MIYWPDLSTHGLGGELDALKYWWRANLTHRDQYPDRWIHTETFIATAVCYDKLLGSTYSTWFNPRRNALRYTRPTGRP